MTGRIVLPNSWLIKHVVLTIAGVVILAEERGYPSKENYAHARYRGIPEQAIGNGIREALEALAIEPKSSMISFETWRWDDPTC